MFAIITGGNRGIGFATLNRLLKIDYSILVVARKMTDELESLIKESGNKIIFFKCDISNKEDRKKLSDYLKNLNLNIDLLVNCAGVAPRIRRDMLNINEDDFDYVMNINQKGTFFITQMIANIMKTQMNGKIINISSISSYTASIHRAEYCLSKSSISMMTKIFAARLAEFNIGVFEISPGIIDTDMTACVKDKYIDLINNGLTPIKRMGKPDDVASCVEAISRGYMDFCTGTVINADGGFNIRRL